MSTAGYHADGEWKGHKKWQCEHCAWDCLSEKDMIYHVTMIHTLSHLPKQVPMDVTLYDGGGNLITHKDKE